MLTILQYKTNNIIINIYNSFNGGIILSSPFDGFFDIAFDVAFKLREKNRQRRETERRRREKERRAREAEEQRRRKEEARLRRKREEDARRRREEERRRKEEDERKRKAVEEARKIKEAEERACALQKQAERAAETRALREARKAQEELASLKRAEETRMLREVRKENEHIAQERICEEKRISLMERLEQVDAIELSETLRNDAARAKYELEALSRAEDIEVFNTTVLLPLLRRCQEHHLRYETYLSLKEEYQAAAEIAGVPPIEIPFGEDAEKKLRDRIVQLEENTLAESQREYIHQAMDEEMKNMGYKVIGTRNIASPHGLTFIEELYQLEDDGVAASVIYQSDGRIAVEIGALTRDDGAYERNIESMTGVLEDHQRNFCSKAVDFEKNMAEKGVICKINRLPPDGAHAPVFCVEDYAMQREVSFWEDEQGRFADSNSANRLSCE